jgi:protein-tyrosine phosphatase
VTVRVAITNFFSAHCKDVLAEHGVQAVLCLDQDLQGSGQLDRGIECIRVVHLCDGPNEMFVFREAVTSLEELQQTYSRVVVHCRAGRSRSIAVVAAFLKKARGMEGGEALEFVKAKRDSAVAPELVRLVERFEV